MQGARNRAAACRERRPDAAFAVGLEGGCKVDGGQMACLAWMCILDAEGVEGRGCAALFYLPKSMAKLVESGTFKRGIIPQA